MKPIQVGEMLRHLPIAFIWGFCYTVSTERKWLKMNVQYEDSCGAVVFTRQNGVIQYVIVQSLEGWYGYPKGHIEEGETEREAALREIREETGLNPEFVGDFRFVDVHAIPGQEGVMKRIIYFLAEYADQPIQYQKEELQSAKLMSFEEAMASFQFESSKTILTEADRYLREHTL